MIKSENLDFWVKNNYNVLFVGEHGVGKTAMVKEAFERNELKWKYYSASTMDPWVDLVGVPKEMKNENGTSYLDLVRPKEFQEDEVEALFFDEFNRAHKKVRNAVMELLQFKSINGKPFKNLRLIWAAINPDGDDLYDVESLDPAQEDRFQIKVNVPYKPHLPYFASKYGEDSAKSAISWWTDLPEEQKKLVSPRRLDYALDVLQNNGDVRFVLDVSVNVTKLLTTLELGPVTEKLKELRSNGDFEKAKEFLANENNYLACINKIINSDKNLNFFIPCLSNEKIAKLMADNDAVFKSVMARVNEFDKFNQIANDIVAAKTQKLSAKILNYAKKYKIQGLDGNDNSSSMGSKPLEPFNAGGSISTYDSILDLASKYMKNAIKTTERKKAYSSIADSIPDQMPTEQALKTLEVFGEIAERSQVSTLLGYTKFIPICNHCIKVICENENIPEWKFFIDKYIERVRKLVFKIRIEQKLKPKIYMPSVQKEVVWFSITGKPVNGLL